MYSNSIWVIENNLAWKSIILMSSKKYTSITKPKNLAVSLKTSLNRVYICKSYINYWEYILLNVKKGLTRLILI